MSGPLLSLFFSDVLKFAIKKPSLLMDKMPSKTLTMLFFFSKASLCKVCLVPTGLFFCCESLQKLHKLLELQDNLIHTEKLMTLFSASGQLVQHLGEAMCTDRQPVRLGLLVSSIICVKVIGEERSRIAGLTTKAIKFFLCG